MKNKIDQLRAEADELGVTPELLALCYIHEALATLQGITQLKAMNVPACQPCCDCVYLTAGEKSLCDECTMGDEYPNFEEFRSCGDCTFLPCSQHDPPCLGCFATRAHANFKLAAPATPREEAIK